MARRDQVQRLADKLGVEFTSKPAIGFLDAWTPKGKIFKATTCHCIALHYNAGPWTSEMYDEMLELLKYGIDDCPDENCDYCTGGG